MNGPVAGLCKHKGRGNCISDAGKLVSLEVLALWCVCCGPSLPGSVGSIFGLGPGEFVTDLLPWHS